MNIDQYIDELIDKIKSLDSLEVDYKEFEKFNEDKSSISIIGKFHHRCMAEKMSITYLADETFQISIKTNCRYWFVSYEGSDINDNRIFGNANIQTIGMINLKETFVNLQKRHSQLQSGCILFFVELSKEDCAEVLSDQY